MSPAATLLTLLLAGASAGKPADARMLRQLRGLTFERAPALLRSRGVALKPTLASTHSDGGNGPDWTGAVAYDRAALWLTVEVQDARAPVTSEVSVTLHFPGAGVTAPGRMFRLAPEGRRQSADDEETPTFAQEAVEARGQRVPGGFHVTARLPVLAWPRFPATGEAKLDVCIRYENAAVGAVRSNCEGGAMADGPVALPSAFRQGLGVKPPSGIQGLEEHPLAWLGFGAGPGVSWVGARAPVTLELLKRVFEASWVDPASVGLALPARLALHSGPELLPMLTGKNPFDGAATCDAHRELRLALYRPSGNTARQVLEWPAATCALGRATSVQLDEDELLTVGYSSGGTVSFVWSQDHFERTELGRR